MNRNPVAFTRPRLLLPLLLTLAPAACVSAPQPRTGPLSEVRSALSEVDALGALLLLAGLPADRLAITLPPGTTLSAEVAAGIRVRLRLYPPSAAQYGPRQAVISVLRRVEAMPRPESREQVAARIADFSSLSVLRPDGCLVPALAAAQSWGNTCVGPVEVQGESLVAASFEVGGFYQPHGNDWQWVLILPVSEPAEAQCFGG